jgi:hypothetical protein
MRRASGSVVGCGIGQPTRPGSILRISSGLIGVYPLNNSAAFRMRSRHKVWAKNARGACGVWVSCEFVHSSDTTTVSQIERPQKKLIVYVRLQ